jgi:predicted phage terminase large subunit-like protein
MQETLASDVLEPQTSREEILREALKNPQGVTRELNNRSLYHFLQYFWPIVSPHTFQPNWHIEYLCKELEKVAQRVGDRQPRLYDVIINVPPGTTKTLCVSVIFPVWCWTRWHWMKFITASYSERLALEGADFCRDIVKSDLFRATYPEIGIKDDKDTKSNFKIVKKVSGLSEGHGSKLLLGGGRYSTSVGATITGFHGDILIIDDPLNPTQAASDVQLAIANQWMEQSLPTRKTDKDITPTILIMQRLSQNDPSGHWLDKQKENIKHICLPGEIRNYEKFLKPVELKKFYDNDLLDKNRLSWKVLKDLETDLGQYGYAGQIGQNPTPPGGGMFKVDRFSIVNTIDRSKIVKTVRYWDKAGTQGGGAYTVGVKMSLLIDGKWIVEDVRRGQWSSELREQIIRDTAVADGIGVVIWVEQEPGSGGKESAENTIRNLSGFSTYAEKPTGDKTSRADPFSVQVNNGSVLLLYGIWNKNYIDELRFFPFSTFKDQTDASSGAFGRLVPKKIARRII